MQITLCKEPFEYIIVDNTYTEEELKFIFLELKYWNLSGHLMGADHTHTAIREDGTPKKKNKGIFLDNIYENRKYSNILNLNRKLYKLHINQPSVVNEFLKYSNSDTTLVSYYENEDCYEEHNDFAILTSLTYLYETPKYFEGGDLVLTEYGIAFEPWFNRTYIIPSVVRHEVTKVIMKQEDCGKGLGRYCISNFIHRNA